MDINIIAPVNSLGYGVASLNIMKALHKLGNRVAYFPIAPGEVLEQDAKLVKEWQANAKDYKATAPCLRIWMAKESAMHVGKGTHCVYPFFELDRLTEEEAKQLSKQDIIFVASHWAQKIVYASKTAGWFDVQVAPLGVDQTIFHAGYTGIYRKTTVFFNSGKWEIRKGHDILVQAFNKAFEPSDDVMLIMNCYSPFLKDNAPNPLPSNRSWELLYRRSKLGQEGKIKINTRRLPDQYELARLMSTVDCGVFPARAEGWNLEALEMLAIGKDVIATNYSAHTEFLNNDNSYLIDIDKLEPAIDNIWFRGEGQWAVLGTNQIDQLVEYMRTIHKRKQERGHLPLNIAALETAKQFSWENTAKAITQRLQHV